MEVLSLEYLQEIGIKILLVFLCGGLIGIERGHKKRPAGFRTHVLVCMGAMTIMLMSSQMYDYYYINYNHLIDPSRIGAQVVSGVGFLGAGTIMKSGTNIRGLTTAATIWTVAIIGLVIGAGYYILAICVSFLLGVVLMLFSSIERIITRKKKVYEIHVKLLNKNKILGAINFLLAQYEIKILDLQIHDLDKTTVDIPNTITSKVLQEDLIEMYIIISGKDSSKVNELIKKIDELQGVLVTTLV